MKIRTLLFTVTLLTCGCLYAVAQQPASDTRWFRDAKLGMFVHFGPYSVLGAGEWVMNTRPITAANYMRLQELFNPHSFDAAEWVSAAKSAGAKYITFTSRHHDGFSNWDTKQSEWNIMNTPFGRDMLAELAAECQKEDMKLVLYYSLIDWMRPDYQWETGRTGQKSGREGKSDFNAYFEFMKAQLTELLTGYGPIAGIWFDGHWDQTADENRTEQSANIDWRYPELYGHIKSLQPECLIANNHHLPIFPGEDYQIFERDVPGENEAGYSGQEVSTLPLETCQTINRTWGFNINDDQFKSTEELIRLVVRTSGRGANLLLNVGPMPNGKIQPECTERLSGMGEWMSDYGYTLYCSTMGPITPQEWGVVTQNGKTLYVHLLDPAVESITVPTGRVESVGWVNGNLTQEQISWKNDRKTGETIFSFAGQLDPVDSIIQVILR